MKKYLFLILFVFISVSPNNLFASEYSGKEYVLKSKDIRIVLTDVDVSGISGLRSNEGILKVDIDNLYGDDKDISLMILCSSSNYTEYGLSGDICNNEFIFNSKSNTEANIHYLINPNSKLELEFTVFDRDNSNYQSYILKTEIKSETKLGKIEIEEGKTLYAGNEYTLTWDGSPGADVNNVTVLLAGGTLAETGDRVIGNIRYFDKNYYKFILPRDIKPGNNFSIQLIGVVASGVQVPQIDNLKIKKAKSSKIKITSPKDGTKVYFGDDFLLKWNIKTNGGVNILNCMPDKTECVPINVMSSIKNNRGKVYIPGDSIFSGSSLIKIENALDTSKFDFVEVTALPKQ